MTETMMMRATDRMLPSAVDSERLIELLVGTVRRGPEKDLQRD
jgi:hypothetical protein